MNERHEKWTRVEPGHVIPAGQPYRIEYAQRGKNVGVLANEFCDPTAWTAVENTFVDSSWKPPLVLPTTPTWGIAYTAETLRAARWQQNDPGTHLVAMGYSWPVRDVLDFIPLTDEQVARIEAER